MFLFFFVPTEFRNAELIPLLCKVFPQGEDENPGINDLAESKSFIDKILKKKGGILYFLNLSCLS